MSVTLSNLTLSNYEYSVTSSNPLGTLKAFQPATATYTFQYKPYITSNFQYNYTCSIKDATSNLSVRLQGSNLSIFNQSSNLFNNFTPYLVQSAFNTIGINRYDNSVIVSINSSNIVRVTSSNQLPSAYSNSYIEVTASNGGVFKDITLQPVGVTNTPMKFTKPIKATTITASNITSCNLSSMNSQITIYSNNFTSFSNQTISNITTLSNGLLSTQATANWSSNNLYQKSGGNITGNVGIKTTSPSYELDVTGDIRIMRGAGNPTTLHINPTGLGNTQSIIQFVNNGHYITCFDSNINGWSRPGSGHNIFYVSGGHFFSGNVSFNNTIGGTAITNLSNVAMFGSNLSPKVTFNSNTAVWSSNTATATSNAVYTSTTASTAIYSSNTATWSSNNNINRSIDYISNFFTDNLVFPNSLNIIGSGWAWSNGWKSYDANGGFLFRNGQDGGLQFYTGTSNTGLGLQAVLTSNGNLGIGTSTPTQKMEVAGNARLNNSIMGDVGFGSIYAAFAHSGSFSTGGYALLQQNNGETYLNCALGRNINIRQNNANMAVFDSNGRFGINTTSPVYTCHIAGTFYASNVQSPTIDTLSNASFQGYSMAYYSSNTAIWASNVARYSSNYGGALSNLATDALNRGTYGSNTANWASNNLGTFSNNNLVLSSNLNVNEYTTLLKGRHGASGVNTHLPYTDGVNYIRGRLICGDSSNAECVHIGDTSAGINSYYKLSVAGPTRLDSLRIGGGDEIYKLNHYAININGSSGATIVDLTVSGSYPGNAIVLPTIEVGPTYNDVFAVTVKERTTTSIRFLICRADSPTTSWAQTITLKFIVLQTL